MEVTLYNQIQDPITAIDRLGEWFAKSGMTGADNVNAGKVLAWECLAQKKSPTEIMRRHHIVGGKLTDKALAIYADFRRMGGRVKWIKTGDDGIEAQAEFTFDGQTIIGRFTLEMANKQGLVKPGSGWAKTPQNMLRARVLSNTIAMLAPEIMAGLDDDQDEAPAPEINLAPTVATPPAQPKAAPSPAPAVVEAEVVPPAPVAPAPAPVIPPSPVAPPAAPEPAPAAADLLPDDVVKKLEAAIGEHGPAAGKWFMKQGWLKPGQDLPNLSIARANRIINQTDSFIRAITQ